MAQPKSLEEYLAEIGRPLVPLDEEWTPPEPIIMKAPSAPQRELAVEQPKAVPTIAPETPSDVVKTTIAARLGFGPGMDTEALKSAQETAHKRTGMASLMQAGADIGHAIARLPGRADSRFWDQYSEQGKQGVADIAQLRQATAQDQELGRTQKKYALEDEHNDPNSPKAAIYRNTLAPLAKKVGMDPATLKGLSFNELKDVDDIINRQAQLKSSEDMRYAMIGAQREGRSAAREARDHEKGKLSPKEQETITGFDTAISNFTNLKNAADDNFIGPVRGNLHDYFVGSNPKELALRSETGRAFDEYRHTVTGAGAGPGELGILKTRVPSVNDASAEAYKTKAQSMIDEARRKKELYLTNLAKGGKRIDDYAKDPAGIGTPAPSGGGAMTASDRKRLEELRRKKAEGTLR